MAAETERQLAEQAEAERQLAEARLESERLAAEAELQAQRAAQEEVQNGGQFAARWLQPSVVALCLERGLIGDLSGR